MPRYMHALHVLSEPIPVPSWAPNFVGLTLPPILGDHEIERDVILPSFSQVIETISLSWNFDPRPPPLEPDIEPIDVPVAHQTTVQVQLPVTSSTLALNLAGSSVPLWMPGSSQLVDLSSRWIFMSSPQYFLGCRSASPLDSLLFRLNAGSQLPSEIWFNLQPDAIDGSGIPLNLRPHWLQPWDGAGTRCFEDCEYESIVVHLYVSDCFSLIYVSWVRLCIFSGSVILTSFTHLKLMFMKMGSPSPPFNLPLFSSSAHRIGSM